MITSSKTSSAPGRVAERAQRLEEARRRRDDPHVPGDRLDDDRREALAPLGDRRRGRVDVVEGADDRVLRGAGRDAGRRRDPERREARAGGGEQRVRVAVVAAGELEDPVAARERRGRAAARDIDASVPEETSRTFSTDGTASTISAASSTSASVGAPKDVPRAAASVTAATTSGSACPKISGPHDITQST